MAIAVNAQLHEQLLPACTPLSYPNVVYVEAISDSHDLVALAMQINGKREIFRR